MGTVITVIAGIGGLVFTGVATYYSAEVAKDQLEQSREDAEQKAREQATHVSFWIDKSPTGRRRLHIMNGSPDPVRQVFMTFKAVANPDSASRIDARYVVFLPSLRPCSDTVLRQEDLVYRQARSQGVRGAMAPLTRALKTDGWQKLPDPYALFYGDALEFVDRDSVSWRRDYTKLTRDYSPAPQWDGEHWRGAVLGEPPVRQVSTCGNTGG